MPDLISREAAVNAVKALLLDGSTQLVWSSDVLDTLANVPAVAAVPETNVWKWISVKDRLPDEDVDVLVSNGLGIEVASYTTNPTRRWYGMFGNTVYVQYWMPLPEPPKEG